MSTKLGEYEYQGNGKTLETDQRYTVFEADGSIEAYAEGESEPVEMKKASFVSMKRGNLERVEPDTPYRD